MPMISHDQPGFISECLELYRQTLLENVVPFWMEHAIDQESGAIYNCLDDTGRLLSKDRFIWSQGRALWTFSALYNRVEQKQEWLTVAEGIHRYLRNHGRDAEGRWMFRLDGNGNVLEKDTSIYADAFVLNGSTEYYAATGVDAASAMAIETYLNTLSRLKDRSYGVAPYSIPSGMKVLGIPMIFSFFYHALGTTLDRPDIRQVARDFAHQVLSDFYDPDRNVVHELVGLDGAKIDSPLGRVCVPGHVIEAMWFLISIFETTGETDIIRRCCSLIRRHLELGWDEPYGGVFLAIDVDGKEPVEWQKADYKPWWVQVEALVATAYAYRHTHEPWCLEWHQKVRDYAYFHYPVSTGEWTQWLDRYGKKAETAALPVKDPFHLPRALIYLLDLFGSET